MKPVLKKIVDMVIHILTLPVFAWYRCLSLGFGGRKAFTSVMQAVSLLPGISGEWLRRGILKWIIRAELKDACICFGTLFSDPDIRIGNGVYIGPECDLGKISIGDDTIIGSNVQVTSGLNQHQFKDTQIPIRDQNQQFKRVNIGRDCWIGSGSIVCSDIGDGCVIGAGSVVIKALPNYSVAAGNPAQIINKRSTT